MSFKDKVDKIRRDAVKIVDTTEPEFVLGKIIMLNKTVSEGKESATEAALLMSMILHYQTHKEEQ